MFSHIPKPHGLMTMHPRTSEFSAKSAARTTCWYHSGKSSAPGGEVAVFWAGADMRRKGEGEGGEGKGDWGVWRGEERPKSEEANRGAKHWKGYSLGCKA